MVCLTEMSLLFVLFMASSAFAQEIKPLSDADLDAFIKGQIKNPKTNAVEKYACGPSCPDGWVKFNERCFSYFSKSMDWTSAEDHCLSLNAHLVSIHNENENKMVKALIRAYDPKENPTWTGLSDCQKTNSWFWSDGTKFKYSKWNPNEPNHHNGECCGHINWSSASGPQKDWNDIPCGSPYPFVCVKTLMRADLQQDRMTHAVTLSRKQCSTRFRRSLVTLGTAYIERDTAYIERDTAYIEQW
ncbi:galactose-specific lectin nattectin-like [Colossoma macropomum]|uniref:galactose-specific lectin nattectin-like n=1 Tax=Colossoma macropomum TaxID=42526 RepID=UPI001864350D|nr:galactose-specific lectin nattectin-like [Colossoma macropomum]